MEGLLHQIAYYASRHYIGSWTITRWLFLTLLACPFFLPLTFLRNTPWRWLIFGLLLLFSISLLIGFWQIRKQGYLRFEPENLTTTIVPTALSPAAMVPVYASGTFTVSGSQRYFVEERANYQTFETTERVIMVNISYTRFLLVGRSSETELGWWYTFFKPDILQKIQPGQLHFAQQARPALQLTLQASDAEEPATIYLAFDTAEQRQEILADLYVDCADAIQTKVE